MKVFYINTVYRQGSTGRLIEQLANMVEEKGDQFQVAYGRGNHKGKNVFKIGNTICMYLHLLCSRLTDRTGFYSRISTHKLIKKIREFDPDIIHLHNLHGYYINLPILFDYLSKEFTGKVIWTLHDCWLYTGHCAYYTFAGCNKWQENCGGCPQKKEYPKSIVIDNSRRNMKDKKRIVLAAKEKMHIVTVSKWLLSEVEKSYLSACKVQCIYNGIDLNIFKPTENIIKEKLGISSKYMILCVSDGWDKRKGFDRIIELSAQIDKDSVIVMIGLQEEQIKKLPSNIIGLRKTSNQLELVEYYSAADVFFNPSREETFGLVTVEAMACGTPVVVYDTTACTELVDETCGLVLPNDFSIEQEYEKIYLNKKEMTRFCVSRACEFSLMKMKDEYYRLYKSAIT